MGARPIAQAPAWMRRTKTSTKINTRARLTTPGPSVQQPPKMPPAPKPCGPRKHWWNGRAVDEVVVFAAFAAPAWVAFMVFRAMRFGARWYPRVRSFAIAHGRLYVGTAETATRIAACESCIFAKLADGHRYCKGEREGSGCGCPQWRLSRVTYKIQLAGYVCPQGRFKTGRTKRLYPARV